MDSIELLSEDGVNVGDKVEIITDLWDFGVGLKYLIEKPNGLIKINNKLLQADTYCYVSFYVCRCAPFYTKTLSAVCAVEQSVWRQRVIK